MRISKRYVVGSAVFLGLCCLAGLVVVTVTLHQALQDTQETLTDVQERSDEQRNKIDNLEGRVGDVGREVIDVRNMSKAEREKLLAKLNSRTDDRSEALQKRLGHLATRVGDLKKAAEEHARLLAAARANEDVEVRYRELMSPTVRVNARHEVGSGTILWSKKTGRRSRTFILTAWHIVQDNQGEEGSIPLEIDFYEAGDLQRTEMGRIVAKHEPMDLALLEVRGYHTYPHRARIPRRADLGSIRMFSKVYAIGCPLGYSPLPTSGELTSKDKELDGNRYWMVNAPTIFGNSGGGIYMARTRTLIGVLSRISAYKNMIDVAVPHMGLVTPMNKIYDWLDRTSYGFVYKDRLREQALPRTLPASKKKKNKNKKKSRKTR